MKNKRTKIITWLRKLEFSERLGLIDTFLGVLLAVLGIWVSYSISQQQQTVHGFDNLLKNSQRQIDSLAKSNRLLSTQLMVLDSQLVLGQVIQKEANDNALSIRDGNMLKLYSAASSIFFMNTEYSRYVKSDSINRINIIQSIQAILEMQLNNSFLLENEQLTIHWISDNMQLQLQLISFKGSTDMSEKAKLDGFGYCMQISRELAQETFTYVESTKRFKARYVK